ncbi:MAG: recombinase family protein [Phenylobacterium sp.]
MSVDDRPNPVPAAQYLRMSTEHQRYSLEYQASANAAYAGLHGLQIVRTYSDPGVSGLDLAHRKGLQQLLGDVLGGAGFSVLLVYDVSRWAGSKTLMKARITSSSADPRAWRCDIAPSRSRTTAACPRSC